MWKSFFWLPLVRIGPVHKIVSLKLKSSPQKNPKFYALQSYGWRLKKERFVMLNNIFVNSQCDLIKTLFCISLKSEF